MSDSGHFFITYHISGNSLEQAEDKARKLCVEQTVEMPVEAVPGRIQTGYLSKIQSITHIDENCFELIVKCPLPSAGTEISQIINIIYGNISLTPGIKLMDIDWTNLTNLVQGPRFGIEGIRKKLNIYGRALSCTALKPIGLTTNELADLCYKFALSGIDIIKDDHGLSNQESSPFKERVEACCRAVDRAAQKTGKKSEYYPNITSDSEEVYKRFEFAKNQGAGGVLIAPQITGLTMMHALASLKELPVMAHPSFTGSYLINAENGIDSGFYYGSLWRALGADSVIFTNAQGRFDFTEKEVLSIANHARDGSRPFKSSLPTPGGGIDRNTVKNWLEFYGIDTLFLIGGSLYIHPEGLQIAAREFQNKLESND